MADLLWLQIMQSSGLTDLIAKAFGPGAAVLALMFIAAILYLTRQISNQQAAIEAKEDQFRKIIARKDKQLREAAKARGQMQKDYLGTLNDLSNFLERIVRGIDRQDSEFDEHDRDVRKALSLLKERTQHLAEVIGAKS